MRLQSREIALGKRDQKCLKSALVMGAEEGAPLAGGRWSERGRHWGGEAWGLPEGSVVTVSKLCSC